MTEAPSEVNNTLNRYFLAMEIVNIILKKLISCAGCSRPSQENADISNDDEP